MSLEMGLRLCVGVVNGLVDNEWLEFGLEMMLWLGVGDGVWVGYEYGVEFRDRVDVEEAYGNVVDTLPTGLEPP